MNWWEAAILGVVQGLTEFLPISSSGHLVLGQHLLGIEAGGDDVVFEVFVHFGTVLSIMTVYRRPVAKMIVSAIKAIKKPLEFADHYRDDESFRTAMLILVTMVPSGIVYFLFRESLEAAFGSPLLVCFMLLVTGILLLLTVLRKNPSGDLNAGKAFLVGVAQSAAMIPGISRSGATICAALYQNVEPERAANFSFLMLLPVVLGATLIKSLDLAAAEIGTGWLPIIVGTVAAYASGVAAIKMLLRVIRLGRLQYFAYYCFLVGIVGILLLW
ncbi:MAG: undecaprenyl-diphosphate phosphatase [Rhodothermia bacterium]|nr:undecaprenyl-diphosphate phosphatase [Rhodothermia bacterium]NNE36265.1 undecaprenyl-diphosphate phosphatase [Rhodothermales bacterium]